METYPYAWVGRLTVKKFMLPKATTQSLPKPQWCVGEILKTQPKIHMKLKKAQITKTTLGKTKLEF